MDRELNRDEFQRFHDLIYRIAGIHYPVEKLELLTNRIRKRLRASGTATYEAYLTRLQQREQGAELQAFLDSVTTNETCFFRCQRHWDWFRQRLEQLNQMDLVRLTCFGAFAPLGGWPEAGLAGEWPDETHDPESGTLTQHDSDTYHGIRPARECARTRGY